MKASVKYKVIYRHREKYSIREMCRFFGVSRSGYYGYVKRMEIPAKDLPLAEKIRECQAECKSTYGYRRVQIWLERHGIYHNPKTILRVMNKYSLLSVIRRKRYVKCGEALHHYPNLLNRNFAVHRPNQKWVTDISYIRTGQGFLYLSVIRDLYDKEENISVSLTDDFKEAHVKSIVNPRRVFTMIGCHEAAKISGYAADSHGQPIKKHFREREPQQDVIRINHYAVKSREEFVEKQSRGRASGTQREVKSEYFNQYDLNDIEEK